MTSRELLTDEELQAALADLPGWAVVDGKLHKEFVFANFSEALGWMVRAGIEAERMDHHPAWFNVYKTVRVDLDTHDKGGITGWDVKLAKAMDGLAG